MDQNDQEIVRGLMREMRRTLERRTLETAPDCDARLGMMSERVATLTAELSLPEILALSASQPPRRALFHTVPVKPECE